MFFLQKSEFLEVPFYDRIKQDTTTDKNECDK